MVGERYVARSRVVTSTDIDLFATMTGAVNPLFLSDNFAKTSGYKSRIAPGLLTLSLMVGSFYQTGLFDHLIALAAIEKVNYSAPVFAGDMLHGEGEVISKRESKKPDRGLITFKSVLKNQNGEQILVSEFTLVYKRKNV